MQDRILDQRLNQQGRNVGGPINRFIDGPLHIQPFAQPQTFDPQVTPNQFEFLFQRMPSLRAKTGAQQIRQIQKSLLGLDGPTMNKLCNCIQ